MAVRYTKIGRMSPEDFQKVYDKFDGSVNGMAKKYNTSRSVIYKKIEECGIDRPPQPSFKQRKKKPKKEKSARQKQVEADVAKTATIVNDPETAQLMFTGGDSSTNKSFLTLNTLAMFLTRVQSNLDSVTREMDGNTGKMKPYQIDLMLKLIKEGRGLIGDTHKIRKDLFDMQGTMAFMEAVVRVLERQIPDVQEQLFLELSQLGFEEQVTGAGNPAYSPAPDSERSGDEAVNSS